MSVCPCACLLPTCIPGVCIRKTSDPLGLEVEMVMRHGVGAGKLGIKPPPPRVLWKSKQLVPPLQPQSGSLQCETGQYFHVALSASVKLSNLNSLEKSCFRHFACARRARRQPVRVAACGSAPFGFGGRVSPRPSLACLLSEYWCHRHMLQPPAACFETGFASLHLTNTSFKNMWVLTCLCLHGKQLPSYLLTS